MNTILYLILIQFIIVVIIDDSGFVQNVLRKISKLLTNDKISKDNYDIKPFTCSYCMNFWCGLTYLLIIGQCTLPYIAIVLLLSTMVVVTKESINLVRDILIKIINKIYDLIEK